MSAVVVGGTPLVVVVGSKPECRSEVPVEKFVVGAVAAAGIVVVASPFGGCKSGDYEGPMMLGRDGGVAFEEGNGYVNYHDGNGSGRYPCYVGRYGCGIHSGSCSLPIW